MLSWKLRTTFLPRKLYHIISWYNAEPKINTLTTGVWNMSHWSFFKGPNQSMSPTLLAAYPLLKIPVYFGYILSLLHFKPAVAQTFPVGFTDVFQPAGQSPLFLMTLHPRQPGRPCQDQVGLHRCHNRPGPGHFLQTINSSKYPGMNLLLYAQQIHQGLWITLWQ